MKAILLFGLSLLISINTYAQFPMGGAGASNSAITGNIIGSVIDSASNRYIEFAAVSVLKSSDNKPVNGVITDSKGNFKIVGLKLGKYNVVIAFIGYEKLTLNDIELSEAKPDFKIKKIKLIPIANTLGEVNVVGEAALIENRVDKIVYNAEKDITSQNGDAGDVLRKAPMVSVDQDGNVSLKGSSNVRVLINGKPSGVMAGSTADALKLIPADQIKSVEIITNPSSKYDAEGTAGIINIITIKKNIEGINGSVNGSVGTRQNNTNYSINYRKGRFGINSNLGGNWSWPRLSTQTFYRIDTSGASLNQSGISDLGRGGGRGNLGFDYDINGYNNISSNISVNGFGRTLDGNTNTVNTLSDNRSFETNRYTQSSNIRKGVDWNLDYKHTGRKNKEEEFTSSFQMSRSAEENDNFYRLNKNPDEISRNDGKDFEYTGQVDYVKPITKSFTIETGAKGILRLINSEYHYYTGAIENPGSESFNYSQNVYAGYLSSKYSFAKKYSIQAGARTEITQIAFDFKNQSNSNASNDYYNIVPSIVLAKNLSEGKSVKLNYTQRVQRPSLRFLNPFTDYADPKNISLGNPDLKPELTHSMEVTYSSFWKGIFLTSSLFYKKTYDNIESYLTVKDSISTTTFLNNSNSDNYGLNMFGSITAFKILTIRGNLNAYYVVFKGTNANANLTNSGYLYNGNIMGTLTLKKGWSVEGFSFLNSPRRTLQGINPSFSMIVLGAKKEFWNKKASLGISISNPFQRDRNFTSELGDPNFNSYSFYQKSNFAVPLRSFGISFRYQFGKLDFKNQMRGGKKKGVNNDDLKQGGDSGM